MSVYSIDAENFVSMQSRSSACAPYFDGYVRLDGDDEVDETYILPGDKGANIPADYPFIFVLAHFGDTTKSIIGISAFNPGEFQNGHSLLAKKMIDRFVGRKLYISMAGVLYISADGICYFIDSSGHYNEHILPTLYERYGKGEGYDRYVHTYIIPMITSAFAGTVKSVDFMRFPSQMPSIYNYNTAETTRRFRGRACGKRDYQVYADMEDCKQKYNSMGSYCKDAEEDIRSKIVQYKEALRKGRIPATLSPLVDKLVAGTISDDEIMDLQKNSGNVLPLSTRTRSIIIKRLINYYT